MSTETLPNVQPSVRFRLPNGHETSVPSGGIIGRTPRAELTIPDGRVSEAHALVSLRGDDLLLLGLRGRFSTGGAPLSRLALRIGQEITLFRGFTLRVVDLVLPSKALGIGSDDLGEVVLSGVTSVVTGPRPRAIRGWRQDAEVVFWNQEAKWWARLRDGSDQPVEVGPLTLPSGLVLDVRALDIGAVALSATRLNGKLVDSLRIVTNYDMVEFHRPNREVVGISGRMGRIICELATFGVPVPWSILAKEIWGDSPQHRLRNNLDQNLLRLRQRLRKEGIREDLVYPTGTGCIALRLLDGDRVEDRS
ncbi:MAG TPA: hypothetical protein DFR83_14690 [Deltaproteobacteria bacterium]|nr:hypothetical protein [Deltaproteobacteria bacterium]